MTASLLRFATAADFAAIAAITNHYIRNTAIHFGYEAVTPRELQDLWRQHHDLYPWLVAEVDGSVVGYAKAGVYRTRAAYRWSTETGIYLAPERLGRGLGRPLYERLLAVLTGQGFHAAIGVITLPNHASVALHERLGFQPCGVVRQAGFKFDAWHDIGTWQKLLQAPGTPARGLRAPATVAQGT